jgi:hypothetical protein
MCSRIGTAVELEGIYRDMETKLQTHLNSVLDGGGVQFYAPAVSFPGKEAPVPILGLRTSLVHNDEWKNLALFGNL